MRTATTSWYTVLRSRVDQALRNFLAPALILNPQVASTAKRAWIVFCAMPQGDEDTSALCPVSHQDRSALGKMVRFYHCS